MVNIEDFVKRLENVLEYYGVNASAFADKIGVQRSSMSHLLSGRNKPSLDFVMKIVEFFPDVDLYWILLGKGNFPNNKEENQKYAAPALKQNSISNEFVNEKETENSISSKILKSDLNLENEEIDKIVIFYKNGTFKAYSS